MITPPLVHPPTRSHLAHRLSLLFTPPSFISGVGIGQQQYVYHWRWLPQGLDEPEEQPYVFILLHSTRLYTPLPKHLLSPFKHYLPPPMQAPTPHVR